MAESAAVGALMSKMRDALQGVLRVADRNTDEFDAARAAVAACPESVGIELKVLREWVAVYRDEIRGVLEISNGMSPEQRAAMVSRLEKLNDILR